MMTYMKNLFHDRGGLHDIRAHAHFSDGSDEGGKGIMIL